MATCGPVTELLAGGGAGNLVLLVFVLFCYWIYDKIVGIDNMKLG